MKINPDIFALAVVVTDKDVKNKSMGDKLNLYKDAYKSAVADNEKQ